MSVIKKIHERPAILYGWRPTSIAPSWYQAREGFRLRLLEQFANEQHRRRRAIALSSFGALFSNAFRSPLQTIAHGLPYRHVILRRRGTRNERRGRVLDLHLVEQDIAVLRQLDLAGTADKHLQGTART